MLAQQAAAPLPRLLRQQNSAWSRIHPDQRPSVERRHAHPATASQTSGRASGLLSRSKTPLSPQPALAAWPILPKGLTLRTPIQPSPQADAQPILSKMDPHCPNQPAPAASRRAAQQAVQQAPSQAPSQAMRQALPPGSRPEVAIFAAFGPAKCWTCRALTPARRATAAPRHRQTSPASPRRVAPGQRQRQACRREPPSMTSKASIGGDWLCLSRYARFS